MTFLEAADRVLEEFGQQKHMHYRVITQKAIDEGWLVTNSKVPESTMAAQIKIDTDRSHDRGITPRFVRHGKGFYGLSKWIGRGLEHQIERHNQRIRSNLLEEVRQLPPDKFEALTGQLLTVLGFEVQVTNLYKDGGVDVRGTLVIGEAFRTRMAVQAKRWGGNVGAKIVQELRGALGDHEQGLVITTSDFTRPAIKEAYRPDAKPISLMNGEQLARLLVENGVGVKRSRYDVIELGNLNEDIEEDSSE